MDDCDWKQRALDLQMILETWRLVHTPGLCEWWDGRPCTCGLELAINSVGLRPESFEEVWRSTGFMYGEDELENVRLGWDLAHGYRPS